MSDSDDNNKQPSTRQENEKLAEDSGRNDGNRSDSGRSDGNRTGNRRGGKKKRVRVAVVKDNDTGEQNSARGKGRGGSGGFEGANSPNGKDSRVPAEVQDRRAHGDDGTDGRPATGQQAFSIDFSHLKDDKSLSI